MHTYEIFRRNEKPDVFELGGTNYLMHYEPKPPDGIRLLIIEAEEGGQMQGLVISEGAGIEFSLPAGPTLCLMESGDMFTLLEGDQILNTFPIDQPWEYPLD